MVIVDLVKYSDKGSIEGPPKSKGSTIETQTRHINEDTEATVENQEEHFASSTKGINTPDLLQFY